MTREDVFLSSSERTSRVKKTVQLPIIVGGSEGGGSKSDGWQRGRGEEEEGGGRVGGWKKRLIW
jgi:hypothetical protein